MHSEGEFFKVFKLLNRKKMLLRLPISLTQIKVGKTFENFWNDSDSLCPAEKISKKIYNKIVNSIKV